MNQAATEYLEQGRVFLAQAETELELDDLRQASEKGWGAAAQLIKAAASERGWDHDRHGLLYRAARRLAGEVGDSELRRQFAMAGELHSNYYEGFMDKGDVELHLHDVTQFVERVERVLNNGSSTA